MPDKPVNSKNLNKALNTLMSEVKQTANSTGGNVVANLKTMWQQVTAEYQKITKENRSIQDLKKYLGTVDGSVFAISLVMLCNSIIPTYGKDAAASIITAASQKPPIPPQLNPKVVQRVNNNESKDMKRFPKQLNEKSLDLKYLPAETISWLFDKPDAQVNTAKDIGVACHEVGNPIVAGLALSADRNILVLKVSNGAGRFHVYPDGGRSFLGKDMAYPKLLDGHEDVERLIGVQEEVDVAQDEEMEPEMEPMAIPTVLSSEFNRVEPEIEPEEDSFDIQTDPRGLIKIKGFEWSDLM